MIDARLQALVARHGSAAAILAGGTSCSYAELARMTQRLAARWQSELAGAPPVGVAVASLPLRVATLAALNRLGATAFAFANSATSDWIDECRTRYGLRRVICEPEVVGVVSAQVNEGPDVAAQPPGGVVLFTSGTSGPPKPARHTWESLAAAVHEGDRYAGRRWLLSYDPSTFAGLQVWLQALLTGGTVCVPERFEPEALAAAIVRDRVEFASGTPTFWRLLIGAVAAERLAGAALSQITLGGEAVDQPVLDLLRVSFSRARISHLYASTEMGVCFSVHDGQAGFPAELLESAGSSALGATLAPGCRLRISDEGELLIASRRAMQGFVEGAASSAVAQVDSWFPTGDLVERRGNRVYFVGRKSGAINVGGQKVYPEEVEAVIRTVAGVRDVRVSPLASSVVGQLVRAEVQPATDADRAALRVAILAVCRERLPKYKLPAVVDFSAELSVTGAGKLARAQGAAS